MRAEGTAISFKMIPSTLDGVAALYTFMYLTVQIVSRDCHVADHARKPAGRQGSVSSPAVRAASAPRLPSAETRAGTSTPH